MDKMIRRLLVAACILPGAALLGLAASTQSNYPPHHIVFDADLIASLGKIADTATVEHDRCLGVGIVGDTAYIVTELEPKVLFSSPDSIIVGACPRGYLVTWHYHMTSYVTATGRVIHFQPPFEWLCDLSASDRYSMVREDQPYWLVHVNSKIYCLFVKFGYPPQIGRIPLIQPDST